MIKATMTTADGSTILLIGLSHGNLDKLRADGLKGFIQIKGQDVGIPIDVMITAGETEAAMAEALDWLIGPDTQVHVSETLKS